MVFTKIHIFVPMHTRHENPIERYIQEILGGGTAAYTGIGAGVTSRLSTTVPGRPRPRGKRVVPWDAVIRFSLSFVGGFLKVSKIGSMDGTLALKLA